MHGPDLLPDSQADTRPDAPQPMLTSSHAATHVARVERLIERLEGRPGGLAAALVRQLRKLVIDLWSWTRCPPTPEVRERKLALLDALDNQVMSALMGDR